METVWVADRITLRTLRQQHPDWRLCDLAEAVNRSLGWVKKWLKRFATTSPTDQAVVRSRSCARHRPPARVAAVVVARILDIRDHPPANLQRVPGPKAILYYLHQDAALAQQATLPRSTRTIWRILRAHDRIPTARPRQRRPTPVVAPMTVWQLDFEDVSTVAPDPDGKQQHVVEIRTTVDVGTSMLVDTQARADFTAETALMAVATMLERHGLPDHVSLDRDPRWVGSQHQRDFPAPVIRFLQCVGVEVTICPPRRPDKNGFVERYHRTLSTECLQIARPATLGEVRECITQFQQHYNTERPHQGRQCANRPPQVAFPALPARPRVPTVVDSDRWLAIIDGHAYTRRVGQDGVVRLDGQHYYVTTRLAGQVVLLRIDAPTRLIVVEHDGKVAKRIPLRGVGRGPMPYAAYVTQMQAEARTEARRRRSSQYQRRLPLE